MMYLVGESLHSTLQTKHLKLHAHQLVGTHDGLKVVLKTKSMCHKL